MTTYPNLKFAGRFKELDRVQFIAVHCSATPDHMDIGAKEIHQWHRERGWAGCGYHLIIRRDGSREVGRPLWAQGAHVRGYNDRSIGVCLIGGTDNEGAAEDNFSDDQFEALTESLIVLSGLARGPLVIQGHCDFPDVNKACPAFGLETEILEPHEYLRQFIRKSWWEERDQQMKLSF